MFPTDGRPGDARGFLHKSFIGKAIGKAVTTFLPGASTLATGISTARTLLGRGRGRSTVPRTLTARITATSQAQKQLGAGLKFGGGAPEPRSFAPARSMAAIPIPSFIPCIFPAVRDEVTGKCILGERPGRDLPGDQPIGEAVMGQYGAALVPGSMPVDRAVCLRGMQLGNDGLCYNKGQITNKQRMWPAGRKPLLTGGDMRAISTAARAGRRLEGATKRLQRMGMMKKPIRRTLPPHRHARAATDVVSV